MNDQAYTQKTLRRLVRRRDFLKHPHLRDETALRALITETIDRAKLGFGSPIQHSTAKLRRKMVYKLTALSDELALRKASNNIRLLTGIKQQDRDLIVKNLIAFLQEGVPYRIYKLDIRSFYESLEARRILTSTSNSEHLSRNTKRVVETFLQNMALQGVTGLPRGLSISATLAEAALCSFDKFIKVEPNVHFFARFVDDILIITSGEEAASAFIHKIESELPRKLEFNTKKQKQYVKAVPEAYHQPASQPPEVLAQFDYLGYRLRVLNPPLGPKKNLKHCSRPVEVLIAPKKVARLKTRIVKSLLHYEKDLNFPLLRNRFRFLTGNYELIDKATGIRSRSGIYYNYNLINKHDDLDALDRFIRSALLSRNWTKIAHTTSQLTAQQRRQLLRCSFRKGFSEKTQYSFSEDQIQKICRCWAYE